jgi:hypothetical protein
MSVRDINHKEKIMSITIKGVETGVDEWRGSDYSMFGSYGIVANADGTYTKHIASGMNESVTLDAPADMIQAYKDKLAADEAERKAKWEAYLEANKKTPEQIKAEAEKEEASKIRLEAKLHEEGLRIQAMNVCKGKKVRVVAGRNVAKGTEGIVFWMKSMTFNSNFGGYRHSGYNKGEQTVKIGIALDDTKDAQGRFKNVAWTYLKNVEVVL